jgi:hypothetical protein
MLQLQSRKYVGECEDVYLGKAVNHINKTYVHGQMRRYFIQ